MSWPTRRCQQASQTTQILADAEGVDRAGCASRRNGATQRGGRSRFATFFSTISNAIYRRRQVLNARLRESWGARLRRTFVVIVRTGAGGLTPQPSPAQPTPVRRILTIGLNVTCELFAVALIGIGVWGRRWQGPRPPSALDSNVSVCCESLLSSSCSFPGPAVSTVPVLEVPERVGVGRLAEGAVSPNPREIKAASA